MKRMLGLPRMVRDLLALLPAEWTAAVDASVLRELPTELIGARGDKRTADLCWLAGGGPDGGPEGTGGFGGRGGGFGGRGGGPEGAGAGKEAPGAGPAIVLIENQSAPDPRMPARTTARTGLLYESLGAAARGPDGKFPPLLIVVVYTGKRPWRAPDDLGGMVRMPAGHPLSVPAGPRHARLDLRDPAAQYPGRGNRMAALARLTFAESYADAIALLGEVRGWMDFGDGDEARLYQCYLDWFRAAAPEFRPRDWDPERERKPEELMAEQSILQRNNERWLKRHRQEWLAEGHAGGLAEGRREGHAEGRREGHAVGRREGHAGGLAEGRREALVRLAARRFGADTGRRLEARLRAVEDPGRLDRVGDLIVDSETGEQLLGGIDRAGPNSS